MTPRDVRVLKFLYTGILSDELRAQVNDGYSFLLALEKIGRVDESNFKHILHVLRIITRHDLLQYVTLRRRKTGESNIRAISLLNVKWAADFERCYFVALCDLLDLQCRLSQCCCWLKVQKLSTLSSAGI